MVHKNHLLSLAVVGFAIAGSAAMLWCSPVALFHGSSRPERATTAVAAIAEPASLVRIAASPVPPVDAASSYYSAPPGTVLAFAFTANQRSDVQGAADQQRATLQLITTGTLRLVIHSRCDREILVEVSLPRMQIDTGTGVADQAELTAMRQSLAAPTLLRMQEDGAVLGWHFPDEMEPPTRAFLRGLIAMPRCVVAAPTESNWTTHEVDPGGTHEVQYCRLPDVDGRWVVRRNRHRFAPNAPLGGSPAAAMVSAVRDNSTMHFDPHRGWMVAANCQESVEIRLGVDDAVITAVCELTMHLVEAHDLAIASVPDWSGAWDSPSAQFDCAEDAQRRQRDCDEDAVQGATAEHLLFEMERIARSFGMESLELQQARERVKARLRLTPSSCAVICRMVVDGSLGEVGIGLALSAIGALGDNASQNSLARLVADDLCTEQVRAYAMYSLFQVTTPNHDAQAAAAAIWQNETASPLLRSTALLLLGTQARGSERRVATLLSLAPPSNDSHLIEAFVEALGNAELYGEVETYLQHPDHQVRDTASRVLTRRPA